MDSFQPDDLIIVGRDGKTLYEARKSLYEGKRLKDPELEAILQTQIEDHGVVLADMPPVGTAGSACVLVNLASIRPPPYNPAPQSKRRKARK